MRSIRSSSNILELKEAATNLTESIPQIELEFSIFKNKAGCL
jgi:hypothetical protein